MYDDLDNSEGSDLMEPWQKNQKLINMENSDLLESELDKKLYSQWKDNNQQTYKKKSNRA